MEMIPHLKDANIGNDWRDASPGQAASRLTDSPGAGVVLALDPHINGLRESLLPFKA